ncbi:SIP domain-containing protein [Pacificibacter marinus]|nr:SIP domain-containing protein [Pacificibacter marinus]
MKHKRHMEDGHQKGSKGHHGGRRAKRLFDYGELRLLVLAMVLEKPRHGYEIIKTIADRFEGQYTPSPGVMYPTLSWLEDVGYITLSPEDGGRKLSRITPEGESFVTANRAAVNEILTRRMTENMAFNKGGDVVIAAMDRLKGALRSRLSGPTSDPDDKTEIAAAIDEAVQKITGGIASKSGAQPKDFSSDTSEQIITRHRFDTKRRALTVTKASYLTPHMIRTVLTGDDLDDFVSLSYDDHIKLFFDQGADKPAMRDYTPRAYDTKAKTLTLDFAIHEAGPATDWAIQAQEGSELTIGGPRGSAVVAPIFDWYLLIGDETALPAIGRRVEELPEGVDVITLTSVPEVADEQVFETAAHHTAHWVHRPIADAADPAPVLDALKGLTLPKGKGFVWIATEAKVARAVRDHVTDELGHPMTQMKASGYWTSGKAAGEDKSLA